MRVLGHQLRRQCAAVLVGCLIAASPAGARAADDDPVIRVESDSPAGKEYEVPLDDARRTGEGEDSGRGAQSPVKPFGEGLGPGSDDRAPEATPAPGASGSGTPAEGDPATTSGAASSGSGAAPSGLGAASGGGGGVPAAAVGGSGPSLPVVAAGFIAGFAVITGGATVLLRRRAA